MNTTPTRIQITAYSILVAEAILESYAEANKFWARYSVMKYRSGKPIGNSVMQRANLPRIWNVGIGEKIVSDNELMDRR